MEEKIQDLVKRVKAKTFHDDFDEQLDTVEELYGRQIRFHFDRAIVEKIIAEETVRELMDLLTERQRQMIQRIYFQQKTQKEVSHELGITVPAVSKCISQAMQKMRNNSDNSARALEKGDWKYAW